MKICILRKTGLIPEGLWLPGSKPDKILFKLEKSFDINIERTELAPEDILTNGDYVQDGVVTADGMAELKRRMPWANMSEFEQNPRVQDFGNLLTVGDLCSYVGSKVGSDA